MIQSLNRSIAQSFNPSMAQWLNVSLRITPLCAGQKKPEKKNLKFYKTKPLSAIESINRPEK
jgi:hypothetical protein